MRPQRHFFSSAFQRLQQHPPRRRVVLGNNLYYCKHYKSTLKKITAQEEINVKKIADSVGVRLTRNELTLLKKKLDKNGNGLITRNELNRVGQKALQEKSRRELCLSVICSPENPLDRWGVNVINFFDYSGTALFSVVGTQVAGDVGMNIVGCGLVGTVAAMGGGSLNTVLYGGASPLMGVQGVRWVANPSYLVVALTASVITFFAWPYYCQTQANHYVENVIGKENLEQDETIGQAAFLEAWQRNPQFQRTIRDALPHVKSFSENDGVVYFEHIDMDGSGDIDMLELEKLVQRRFHNGWETYWLDTFALSALSIAAVSGAVRLGLHPLVAATSGVTVCFGGILRDLLCGRDLAIGGQSYAFATGASSTVYILLRELAIRRIWILPLVVRTFLSAGTCVGLRGWEFVLGDSLLRPMHGRHPKKEDA